MTVLLDTCAFIWLVSEPHRLGSEARERLDSSATIYLSQVSMLEIAVKWNAGKLVLPAPPRTWIPGQLQTWSISSLPLDDDDIYHASELAAHHRDPFDRLLIAQAILRRTAIVTPDRAFADYPVATVW